MVTIPLTVEWAVGDYLVNETTTDIPSTGPLPLGWSRREERVVDDETGKVAYVTVIVPATSGLLTSPELSESFGQRATTAFTDAEVDEIKGELQTLLPTYRAYKPTVNLGLLQGLFRYNRVEGLSVGGSVSMPLGSHSSAELGGRLGTGDLEPNGTLTLRKGPPARQWSASGYHVLKVVGDWSTPFSLKNSLGNLLFGGELSQYYRATGASLGYARAGSRVRVEVDGFYEQHRPVEANADFSIWGRIKDDTVATVLPADRANVEGVRSRLRWFSGLDPKGLILTGELLGEVATGDARYQRAAATMSASHGLPLGLAGALEFGAGALWGDALFQRLFVLGGPGSLRGFLDGAALGESFWRARAELATGFPAARLSLFSDAGWAGPRSEWALKDPMVSVGLGASLMDGLFRMDVARGVRRGVGWRFHIYLDGLF